MQGKVLSYNCKSMLHGMWGRLLVSGYGEDSTTWLSTALKTRDIFVLISEAS